MTEGGTVSTALQWRDRLISFRTLVFIILGLGVVRLIVAVLMPQTPSALAPDEGTYAALAGVVASGGDWASWNYGRGSGLYPGSRALLGPAAVLIFIGLDDLAAVRVISVLYAVGSQLLLLAIARLARQRLAPDAAGGLTLVSWPMLGMAVFVLLPSNVVWSNLGLREAACAFWIIGAVTSTAYLFATQSWKWKIVWGVAIAISISMAFQSRVYLAVALVLALLVGIVWLGKERPRVSLTLAGAVIVGTIVGVTLSLPASVVTAGQSTAALVVQADALAAQAEAQARAAEEAATQVTMAQAAIAANELALQALADADGDVKEALRLLETRTGPVVSDATAVLNEFAKASNPRAELRKQKKEAEGQAAQAASQASSSSIESEALAAQAATLRAQASETANTSVLGSLQQGVIAAPGTLNPDTYLERGSIQREVSAQYANSAIATDSCVGVPNPQSLRWCEITRLPGAAFAVMFRPLWPLDIPAEWSATAVVASIENVAWLVVVASVIWVLVTRRFSMTRLLTISLAYGALVTAGMAALEGNFGTAFRHKSSTLWVLCTVLLLSCGRVGRWPRSGVSSAGGEVPHEGDPDTREAASELNPAT